MSVAGAVRALVRTVAGVVVVVAVFLAPHAVAGMIIGSAL